MGAILWIVSGEKARDANNQPTNPVSPDKKEEKEQIPCT
jgi:hypothetical protein